MNSFSKNLVAIGLMACAFAVLYAAPVLAVPTNLTITALSDGDPSSGAPSDTLRIIDTISQLEYFFGFITEADEAGGNNKITAIFPQSQWTQPQSYTYHEQIGGAVSDILDIYNSGTSAVVVFASDIDEAFTYEPVAPHFDDFTEVGASSGLTVSLNADPFTPPNVPEPSTFVLAGLGLAGLTGLAKIRRR